ncbi:hypothetical protein SAMN04487930_11315 [Cytophaga hutchinsonii ATCC 33406]|nr:hypothetical protein SAMN04487930_11315 [Cytophaga hutchinsonii ATCC 33406]
MASSFNQLKKTAVIKSTMFYSDYVGPRAEEKINMNKTDKQILIRFSLVE